MYQKCVDNQTPPGMEPGETRESGEFFRNLKKEHVAKRYEGDDNDEPEYGFKLHKKHWRYADHQQGQFSVNLQSCIHTEKCSIALQPGGEDYFHVALINLDSLNESRFLTSPFVAQYTPVEECENRCHFEILPLDGTVLKWMEIGELLDSPFPRAKKLPVTPEDAARAKQEYQRYRSCFDIRRWVRKKNGTLE